MRKFIIKILGGHTDTEFKKITEEHKTREFLLLAKTFRTGDAVYLTKNIKHNNMYLGDIYYLLESYNNGNCWYISKDKDDKNRSIRSAVHIMDISHEKPNKCKCCNNFL
jgi:hypothetical protein